MYPVFAFHHRLWIPLAIALTACASRGQPPPAPAVASPHGKVADALGETQCNPKAGTLAPLLVDLKEQDRAAMELALHKSLAVVRYDCRSLQLLAGCTVSEVPYGYVGFTPKERVVRLASADEIGANLSTLGMAWASKLTAELEQGGSLNVALVTVGQRSSPLNGVEQAHLSGECAGATHFIKRGYAGAFAVEASDRKSARTAVEIFGSGVDAKSRSSRIERVRDGDLAACRGATTEDNAPPQGCGALLRVELISLAAGAKASSEEKTCPGGMLFVGGICTLDSPWARCAGGNSAACTSLCDAGEAAACTALGKQAAASRITAHGFYKRACAGGDGEGCWHQARVEEMTDPIASMPTYWQACEQGYTLGCSRWTELFYEHKAGRPTPELRQRLATAKERACKGGSAAACSALGRQYIEPDPKLRVVAASEERALELLMPSCLEHPLGCTQPALLLEGRSWCEISSSAPKYCATPDPAARSLERDLTRAKRLYERVCAHGKDIWSCLHLARLDGLASVQFDAEKVEYAGQACRSAKPAKPGEYVGAGHCAIAAAKDPANAQAYYSAACQLKPVAHQLSADRCKPSEKLRENYTCWTARLEAEVVDYLCKKSTASP